MSQIDVKQTSQVPEIDVPFGRRAGLARTAGRGRLGTYKAATMTRLVSAPSRIRNLRRAHYATLNSGLGLLCDTTMARVDLARLMAT